MIGALILKAYQKTRHNIVDNTSSWDFNSSPPPATKIFKKIFFLIYYGTPSNVNFKAG